MALVCRATWTIKPGKEHIVREALERLCPPSREEPGVQFYQAYSSAEEPHIVRLFEIYDDEEALEVHSKTPHFVDNVLNTVVPVLDHRVRVLYETIDV